jgi:peptide deformylase
MAMETLHRYSLRLRPISLADKCLKPGTITPIFRKTRIPISVLGSPYPKPPFGSAFTTRKPYSSAPSSIARAGWLLGLGENKKSKTSLPDIVKAGDPVLHEPAREVAVEEIESERIQKIIDDMVRVMRKAPGVGLAAPQIGIPLKVSFNLFVWFPVLGHFQFLFLFFVRKCGKREENVKCRKTIMA